MGMRGGDRAASSDDDEDYFDIGIRWLLRNDKMLVAGFDPGCLAKEKDVRQVNASQ